jgi:hypothetical protein
LAPFKPPGTRFGLKRDRRKLHIEPLHMPPELSRATASDTAKALQADTLAQASQQAQVQAHTLPGAAPHTYTIPPPTRRRSLSPPPNMEIVDPFKSADEQAHSQMYNHRLGISLGDRAHRTVDDEDNDDTKLPPPPQGVDGAPSTTLPITNIQPLGATSPPAKSEAESSVNRINSLAAKFAAKAAQNQQAHSQHNILHGHTLSPRNVGAVKPPVELVQTDEPGQSVSKKGGSVLSEGALCGSQMPGLKNDARLEF